MKFQNIFLASIFGLSTSSYASPIRPTYATKVGVLDVEQRELPNIDVQIADPATIQKRNIPNIDVQIADPATIQKRNIPNIDVQIADPATIQ